MYSFITHNGLIINERFFEFLKNNSLADFQGLANFESAGRFKKNRFRSVSKIEVKGKTFYLKLHLWPWREKIKSLVPWVRLEDGRNEWRNMILLDNLGFKTMTPVAFGERRKWWLPVLSLTLTEDIKNAERLETYFPAHFSPPLDRNKIRGKRSLIKEIAILARDFHGKGLNHQDFYLGHLFIRPEDNEILIIDIQRVHWRETISMHDRIKDLAQLTFSAQGLGIFTQTDFMRFIHSYLNKNKLSGSDKRMIKRIVFKERRIARHTVKLLERRKKRK